MANRAIEKYIKDNIERFPINDIRLRLLHSGYSLKDINEAVAVVEGVDAQERFAISKYKKEVAILLIALLSLTGIAGFLYFFMPGNIDCGIGKYDGTKKACTFDISLLQDQYVTHNPLNEPMVVSCPTGSVLNNQTHVCEMEPFRLKCVKGEYNSIKDTCEYTPELKVTCPANYLFDVNESLCIYKSSSVVKCIDGGVYNSQKGRCEIIISSAPDKVCLNNHTYNGNTGYCEYSISYVCSRGSYNQQNDRCEIQPDVIYICEHGELGEINGSVKCIIRPEVVNLTCSDECSSGAKECSNYGYKTCGSFDNDACTEWGSDTACPSGETCSGGICSTNQILGLKILPPQNGIYLGAYDWGDGVYEFEQVIGKKVAIAGFYKNSRISINDGGTEGSMPYFDVAGHENAYQNGYTKFYVGVEYGNMSSPVISPQAVINGALDSYLIKVAQDIEAWGRPVFWVYQREPESTPGWNYDGGGYGPLGDEKRKGDKISPVPWDYENYGCKTVGNPRCLDGWERSRDAARHIHDLVESITPNQVTWIAGASAHDLSADWELENSYPGDDYVDWIAFDYYPCGQIGGCGLGDDNKTQTAYESFNDPKNFLNIFLAKAKTVAPTKPVMLLEFGVAGYPGNVDRSAWFKEFFQAVKTTHTQIKAIMIWQYGGEANNPYSWVIEDGHFMYVGRITTNNIADAKAWQDEIKAYPNFWKSDLGIGGVIPPICKDECSSLAVQCNGTGFQTCADYNNDFCTEWGSITPCAFGCSSGICDSQQNTGLKILPSQNGIYLGAYDWGVNGVSDFEQSIGSGSPKKVAIAKFGKNSVIKIKDGGTEGTMPYFDTVGHENAYQNGYITFYGIEFNTSGSHLPQSVINGALDYDLKKVAQDIKAWGRPLFWFYAREPQVFPAPGFDGGGYGPNGDKLKTEISCGGNYENCLGLYNQYVSPYGLSCNTVGDVMCLDGPERRRDANRHIHDLVESIDPNHVTWVMGGDAGGQANEYKKYYPGDSYVDWHAFDRYPCAEGGTQPYCTSFKSISDEVLWSEALGLSDKPIMFMELGVHRYKDLNFTQPIDRGAWFTRFFNDVRTNPKMKNLKAIMYWQELSGMFNTRVDSSVAGDASAVAAWKAEMAAYPTFWLSSVQAGSPSCKSSGQACSLSSDCCTSLACNGGKCTAGNSLSCSIQGNQLNIGTLSIPISFGYQSRPTITDGEECEIRFAISQPLATGEDFLGAKITMNLPLDSQIHIPDGFGAATLINSSSPKMIYKDELVYQLALVYTNGKWLRLTTKSTSANKYPVVETSSGQNAITLSYSWEPSSPLYIQHFDSMDDAVKDYLSWMKPAFNMPNKPAWLKDIKLVIFVDMLSPDGRVTNSYQDVINLVSDLRGLNAPKTLFYIPGWNYDYDAHYPDYNPTDKLGGDNKFKEMVDAIHSSGYKVMIHTDPAAYDPFLPSFQVFKQYSLGLGWFGSYGNINYMAYDSQNIPISSGVSKEAKIKSPSIPSTTSTPATECDVSISYNARADITFSVNGRNLTASINNNEVALPYTFFFNQGINSLTFSSDRDIDWSNAKYRISKCIIINDLWTHPIVAMNQSSPAWINEFTTNVANVVNKYNIDAVHLDAHVMKSSTRNSHGLFRALQSKIPNAALSAEESIPEFALDTISLYQHGRAKYDYSATYFVSPLSKKLSVGNIYIYDHLCYKNSFVPHWGSCYLNQAAADLSLDSKFGFGDTYKIPTFRLNYPAYGIDDKSKKEIICLGSGKVLCSSSQKCSGSKDSNDCCSGSCVALNTGNTNLNTETPKPNPNCYADCMKEAGNTDKVCTSWCSGSSSSSTEVPAGEPTGTTSGCYKTCMAEAGNTASVCANWCNGQ